MAVEGRGALLDTGTVSEEMEDTEGAGFRVEGEGRLYLCVGTDYRGSIRLWVVVTTRWEARGLEERMMLKEVIGGEG